MAGLANYLLDSSDMLPESGNRILEENKGVLHQLCESQKPKPRRLQKREENSVPECGPHTLIPPHCPKSPLDFRNALKVLLLRRCFLQDLDGRKGTSQGHRFRNRDYGKILPLADKGKWRIQIR